ncbi:MATE family efflux transporter [Litoribrevibacter albus]|uniref:MATE family efflux transporter n=1 Tax=Litoribrevibacter albus TaxID=1473156 RepID=A0AA37S6M0_9GAMM|nr:MATE family efflux transporter [Litoribrevibacter albus]GLQ29917.1 MATE family efflux transporter [Litoribrevibacter albus]
MSKSTNLLDGNIAATLTRQTLPMTLGLISLMLFHLVDSYFVGQLGVKELAALSFSFPITFTLISLSIGLGIGVSAYVAQTIGRGCDKQGIHPTALLLNLVILSFASALGYVFSRPIFSLLGADENMIVLIMDYISFWYLAAPFYAFIMTMNSLQRAAGNTKFPAAIMALSSILNAILDPIFIFGLGPIEGYGLKGAAIASLTAWLISCVLSLIYIQAREDWFEAFPTRQQLIQHSKKILHIGLPAAAANMLTPITSSVLISIISNYGEASVAAFGVGTRIESLAILMILALSMTLPPFISQNFGAKQFDRVHSAIKLTRKFSLAWQFAIYLVLVLCSDSIARFFSDSAEVHDLIQLVIYIMPLGHGAMGIIILSGSSLNALSEPKKALIVSIIRLLIITIPFAAIGGYINDFKGLLIGITLGSFLTAFIAANLVNQVIYKVKVS